MTDLKVKWISGGAENFAHASGEIVDDCLCVRHTNGPMRMLPLAQIASWEVVQRPRKEGPCPKTEKV